MNALERVLAEEWPDGRFGGPRPATPDLTPRGQCAWCQQPWAVNADGTLRVHRIPGDPNRTPCIGSRRQPGTRLRPATSPATAARHRADLIAALTGQAGHQPIPARRTRKASR